MNGSGAEGVTRELDARERAALDRLVERAAFERGSATVEFVRLDPGPDGARGLATETPTVGATPPDLIVACEVGVGAVDWKARLEAVAERAAKGLVLVTDNPHRFALNGHPRAGDGLEVARLLWQLGRVRDCVYMVFPRVVEKLAAPTGFVVAPDIARAPASALVRRTAHLMAYVLDTTPRTPTARRRLRVAATRGEPG